MNHWDHLFRSNCFDESNVNHIILKYLFLTGQLINMKVLIPRKTDSCTLPNEECCVVSDAGEQTYCFISKLNNDCTITLGLEEGFYDSDFEMDELLLHNDFIFYDRKLCFELLEKFKFEILEKKLEDQEK